MITFPVSALADRPDVPRDHRDAAFWRRVAGLEETHRSRWWSCDDTVPRCGDRFDRDRQRRNEHSTRALIDGLAETIRVLPQGEVGRDALRDSLRSQIREYVALCLGWSRGEQQLFFSDESFRVTREFAREARRFDSGIGGEPLFQALRNVWIMNGIQGLLGRPVELTPAVFAYSMLYPYTDNLLDSPDVDDASKRARSGRLDRRLRGIELDPLDTNEHQVFQLVGMIEGQYSRPDFPDVYLGLQAIHRAQCRSLDQHGRAAPYERDILAISVAKGGCSVIADGYLVAGALTDDEAEFLFGYGVLLQLLDDLQDVGLDRDAGHMTIFSQTAEAWPLDRLTLRLLDFMNRVLDAGDDCGDGSRHQSLLLAIRRNCTHLLLQAVADNRALFTSALVKTLESHSPVSFASLTRLRRRAEKRQRAIKTAWVKSGVDLSVWETVG